MFEPIREQIKSKLESISNIQAVYDYPTEDVSGYPAALIETVRNESDRESITENERFYIFNIYLIQESEKTPRRSARRIIEGLVDEVINSFDQDESLTGISFSNSRYTMLAVNPALSEIVSAEKYVTAVIELTVRVSFDKE